jgi:ADP-heptose:LPS heptosyltransferase
MIEPDRILVIRLKSIGDVVFTLPAVHALRVRFPQARLEFLTSVENAEIIAGFPGVDEVLAVDRAAVRRLGLGAVWVNTVGLAWRLRRRRYGLVVDFQGYGETALLTWLTGAPHRWGRRQRASRSWAYTASQTGEVREHSAEWNRILLANQGLALPPCSNRFVLPSRWLDEARAFFSGNALDPERQTLFVLPFTSSAHKDWPLGRFAAVARHWRARGVQVIIGGGSANREALLALARAEGCACSVGVPLLTSAGLARLSTLTLGGVTGLLHLAVAMEKRVLMLVGFAAQETNLPWGHPEWACAPGNNGALADLEVPAVLRACEEALAAVGSEVRSP